MKTKIAVLSDIHIGDNSPTCWYQKTVHEKYLLAILDYIVENAADIQELVLLGDVVDFWTYPFDRRPPSFAEITAANPNIFGKSGGLAKVLDALDGRVTYLPGNHDMGVTAAEAATITSPRGYQVQFVEKNYKPQGDSRVLLTHGNEFTLFNAPDRSSINKWAPLPVGHFVTRTVATYWQKNLKPGQTVADIAGQGAPNGFNWRSIVEKAISSLNLSVAGALLDGVAGVEGVSEKDPIVLADGSKTTLTDAKKIYNTLFTDWIEANGGGEDGFLVASKAAFADYDASYMGWFVQREAFRTNRQLVVLGHTHMPISGLTGSLVNYINSGFTCPSQPDMPKLAISFALVDVGKKETVGTQLMQVLKQGNTLKITSLTAPTTSIVISPFMDFSCYVIIDNSQNNQKLTLMKTQIGNGHFVNLPKTIAAGESATLWLQDYPNLVPPHGSDAAVEYKAADGTRFVFNFDCPTGAYPNSCSGGSSFQARAGDGPWLPPGQVPERGHPLFVHFNVTPGTVQGAFTGNCGENSSAVSTAGLQPNDVVVLNGKTDLSSCMVANDKAAVFGIRLDKVSGIYEYKLSVDARGPKGAFSGSMYLYFTDQSGDRYLLTVFDSTRKTHTLRYNSSAPAIMKIEWSNRAKS